MNIVFIQKHGARQQRSGLRWHTATVWEVRADGILNRIGTYRDQYEWTADKVADRVKAYSDTVLIGSVQELMV